MRDVMNTGDVNNTGFATSGPFVTAERRSPRLAVYYATKAYVLNFSTALAVELEGTGVTVTRRGMTADRVAHEGYDAMRRGKPMIVPETLNKTRLHGEES